MKTALSRSYPFIPPASIARIQDDTATTTNTTTTPTAIILVISDSSTIDLTLSPDPETEYGYAWGRGTCRIRSPVSYVVYPANALKLQLPYLPLTVSSTLFRFDDMNV